MKAMAVSDIHICEATDPEDISALVRTVIQEDPDELVLNGDIFDPWKSTWEDLSKTAARYILAGLTQWRADRGRKTVYIPRNHDYGAPQWLLPGAEHRSSYEIPAGGTDCLPWRFLHGWEFDLEWKLGPVGVSNFAFWLATHKPGLMIPLYRALFGKDTPAQRKNRGFRDDWNLAVETVHSRARLYAQRHKVNLVIGHTHCPMDFDGLVADTGDLVDSYTYLILETGPVDRAELRKL